MAGPDAARYPRPLNLFQPACIQSVMFAYHLKLARKSMRRNPIMTGLMVAAIAVGIGVSMTTLTVHYLMSSNPISCEKRCAVCGDHG